MFLVFNQSCSKPFTYAVGLNELGADVVHQYIGQEPSGRMFNELCLDYSNKVSHVHPSCDSSVLLLVEFDGNAKKLVMTP